MPDRKKKKILIVDDSFAMRLVLRGCFPSNTYEFCEAETASEALAQFEKERPDLMLLDIVMSEGDAAGVEALEQVMKAHPDARVVMISAIGQESTIRQCRKLGAKDYIIKPFDQQIVCQVVEKFTA